MGVRYFLKELVVASKDKTVLESVRMLKDVLKNKLMSKTLELLEELPNIKVKVKADYAKLGKFRFWRQIPKIIAQLTIDSWKQYCATYRKKESMR